MRMKKRLLIVNNNMGIGGIQRALLNLLQEVHDQYDITLLLFFAAGELLSEIPDDVRVLEGGRLTRIMGMSQAEAKRSGVLCYLWRTLMVLMTRAFGIRLTFALLSRLEPQNAQYDCAISYAQNSAVRVFYGGSNEYVLNAVRANRKIAFVHSDFEHYLGNHPYNISVYRRFDRIAAVSDACRARFERVTGLSDRTYTVHNCHDFSKLEVLSTHYEAAYSDGALNIFTAARISREKGILRMLPIFSRLRDKGMRFVWRIAGDGECRREAERLVKELHLSDRVVFLGELSNPYPYFRRSDLLLVPSYNEAAPMVYGEAEYFGLCVLTTDTTSAEELVARRENGWVCENSDEALFWALWGILSNDWHNPTPHRKASMNNGTAAAEFASILV